VRGESAFDVHQGSCNVQTQDNEVEPEQTPGREAQQREKRQLRNATPPSQDTERGRENESTQRAEHPDDSAYGPDILREVVRYVLVDRRLANAHCTSEHEHQAHERPQTEPVVDRERSSVHSGLKIYYESTAW